jgi:hypothetical protein
MTKDAKGRGDAAPPDPYSKILEKSRADYQRTGNPVFVWIALRMIEESRLARIRIKIFTTKEEADQAFEAEPSVAVPLWCWRYLYWPTLMINRFAGLHDNEVKIWDGLRKDISEGLRARMDTMIAEYSQKEGVDLSEVLASAERFKAAALVLAESDWSKGGMTAMQAAKAFPQIFGFVDGKGYNAFYEYWRAEKRRAVAYALKVAKKDGLPPAEAVAFVSEMTGIYDEPTIRRYVKEAQGKALPRRRSKRPKAPKGKKDGAKK